MYSHKDRYPIDSCARTNQTTYDLTWSIDTSEMIDTTYFLHEKQKYNFQFLKIPHVNKISISSDFQCDHLYVLKHVMSELHFMFQNESIWSSDESTKRRFSQMISKYTLISDIQNVHDEISIRFWPMTIIRILIIDHVESTRDKRIIYVVKI